MAEQRYSAIVKPDIIESIRKAIEPRNIGLSLSELFTFKKLVRDLASKEIRIEELRTRHSTRKTLIRELLLAYRDPNTDEVEKGQIWNMIIDIRREMSEEGGT